VRSHGLRGFPVVAPHVANGAPDQGREPLRVARIVNGRHPRGTQHAIQGSGEIDRRGPRLPEHVRRSFEAGEAFPDRSVPPRLERHRERGRDPDRGSAAHLELLDRERHRGRITDLDPVLPLGKERLIEKEDPIVLEFEGNRHQIPGAGAWRSTPSRCFR
jgi:hypothetical protein